jgi:hypothetical protein
LNAAFGTSPQLTYREKITVTTMPKRKADILNKAPSGAKKAKHDDTPKTAKPALLNDSSEDESDGGGAELGFKVNEEYAKRFEHNKKRAELHRCKFTCMLSATTMHCHFSLRKCCLTSCYTI